MTRRKIIPIVEGDGEVEAIPLLLKRLLSEQQHAETFEIARPKNAHTRNNLLKINGIERFLEYCHKEKDCADVLILVDADKDCAKEVAFHLAQRAERLQLPFPVVVVCAKCEYETWFLASIETMAGRSGLPKDMTYTQPVEERRGVKEWLSGAMGTGRRYKETIDQAILTQYIDFALAQKRSRSFRRLEHAMAELLDAAASNQNPVTPKCPVE